MLGWGSMKRVAWLAAAIMCVTTAASAQSWTAVATLKSGGGSCLQGVPNYSWKIDVKDNVLVATSERNTKWTLRLQGLNPDGSGRINAKTTTGYPATFDFAVGQGRGLLLPPSTSESGSRLLSGHAHTGSEPHVAGS